MGSHFHPISTPRAYPSELAGLRRVSAAAGLLRLWVRISPGARMSCECCVLSGRNMCDGLITRPQESFRLFVCLYDREASIMRRPCPTRGFRAIKSYTTKSHHFLKSYLDKIRKVFT